MISLSSILTKAPITPELVDLRYSKGLFLLTVLRKGYRYRGIGASRNTARVSAWLAIHCSRARALQTRLLAWGINDGGLRTGYIAITSCYKALIVPKLYHKIGAKSEKDSLCLLSSNKATSRCSKFLSCEISGRSSSIWSRSLIAIWVWYTVNGRRILSLCYYLYPAVIAYNYIVEQSTGEYDIVAKID
jgi:hypothetical protein